MARVSYHWRECIATIFWWRRMMCPTQESLFICVRSLNYYLIQHSLLFYRLSRSISRISRCALHALWYKARLWVISTPALLPSRHASRRESKHSLWCPPWWNIGWRTRSRQNNYHGKLYPFYLKWIVWSFAIPPNTNIAHATLTSW